MDAAMPTDTASHLPPVLRPENPPTHGLADFAREVGARLQQAHGKA